MNYRFLSPFAPIESQDHAQALLFGSVVAFGVWTVALLVQAGAIFAGMGSTGVAERGATAGFAVFLGVIAALLAVVQWRKPNRLLPVMGIGWSLFDLSSVLVGLMVGAPATMGALPVWAGVFVALVLVLCAILHIGSIRAGFHLTR